MMRAMGWETANIHLGTRAAVKDVLEDLKNRKSNWLRKTAEKMVDVTLKDWKMWRSGISPLLPPLAEHPQSAAEGTSPT
jgi:hypothetical protein